MTQLSRAHHPVPSQRDLTLPVIFIGAFVVLGLIAVFAQLLHLPWRSWFPAAEIHKSLFDGVRASVYEFMAYLI